MKLTNDQILSIIKVFEKMLSEAEFKPCPFCGQAKTIRYVFEGPHEITDGKDLGHKPGDNWAVICPMTIGGCGTRTGYRGTKQEALKVWNTRV